MLTEKEILSFLKQNKPKLKHYKVKRLGLFGSYARGEQHKNSDIDMVVEYEEGGKSFANFLGLVDFLEEAFHQEVELVTAESLSKHIKPYIEKEAKYVQV
jgi:predicted nucleotidyltransferase